MLIAHRAFPRTCLSDIMRIARNHSDGIVPDLGILKNN